MEDREPGAGNPGKKRSTAETAEDAELLLLEQSSLFLSASSFRVWASGSKTAFSAAKEKGLPRRSSTKPGCPPAAGRGRLGFVTRQPGTRGQCGQGRSGGKDT